MSQQTYAAVTPSDTVALTVPVYRVYVGVTGDIAVKGPGDSAAVTFKAVPAGWFTFPGQVTTIMATNTTATNMVVSAGTAGGWA